jgi:AcrR family transcriptional regulator
MSRLRVSAPPKGKRKAPRRRRSASYHHGDLRATLLEEAIAIVREHGLEFVSIREVARRARVSHAAPAHHFGNKSGLLTALAAQGYDRLADVMRDAIAGAGATTPQDDLDTMGRAYVAFALDHPEHFAVMFRTEAVNRDDAEYRRATDRAYGPLLDVVTRAAKEGCLDADPLVVGAAAWSLVHGLASLWMSGRLQERTGASDAGAMSAAVTRLFVDSVVRRTPKPR